MSASIRYPFAKSTHRLCALLKISPERVLRRAGMPADFLAHEGRGATARQLFAIWNAVEAEVGDPDFVLSLGQTAARGPFVPAVFAFSCSPNIEIGLNRLAVFKPLVGPFALKAERAGEVLSVSIASADGEHPLPDTLAAFELVYFIELARTFTAEPIVPLSVGLPPYPGERERLESLLGVAVQRAAHVRFDLSMEDALRPLITESEDMWAGFEKDLRRRLLDRDRTSPMSARVRAALVELLPGGRSTAEAVCERLHVSKRSLHRHLKDEGHSFQALLDGTRTELSLHYLRNEDISVDEISYLLAFSDPNSFYRAFRGWTGMTPMQAREQRTH